MHTQKISISLPQEQYKFIEDYQLQHHYKTRSEVIKAALHLLQQVELESCYREANQEIDDDFEVTSLDGLDENETW
jgi:antitoxin ParD1/3/4